jgi:hypothetical protein
VSLNFANTLSQSIYNEADTSFLVYANYYSLAPRIIINGPPMKIHQLDSLKNVSLKTRERNNEGLGHTFICRGAYQHPEAGSKTDFWSYSDCNDQAFVL